jgi:hypothetical protein
MEKNKTAVDWLFLMLNDPNRNQDFAKKLYDKAKEIEKEHITSSFKDGRIDGYILGTSHIKGSNRNSKYKNSEQYYNANYGKK